MIHPMFHLHTHSYFSFLEGIPSPEELVLAAVEDGMPALALTDHRWLTGAVEFYLTCQKHQIQPVLGLEIDVSLPAGFRPGGKTGPFQPGPGMLELGRLVLLAADRTGWANLCRISSALQAGSNDPNLGILPFEELEAVSAGLICLTGGMEGFPYRWMQADGAIPQPDRWINSWLKISGRSFSGPGLPGIGPAARAGAPDQQPGKRGGPGRISDAGYPPTLLPESGRSRLAADGVCDPLEQPPERASARLSRPARLLLPVAGRIAKAI